MESEQDAAVSKGPDKEVYRYDGATVNVAVYDDGSLWLYDWFNGQGIGFEKDEARTLIKALCVGYDLTIPEKLNAY